MINLEITNRNGEVIGILSIELENIKMLQNKALLIRFDSIECELLEISEPGEPRKGIPKSKINLLGEFVEINKTANQKAHIWIEGYVGDKRIYSELLVYDWYCDYFFYKVFSKENVLRKTYRGGNIKWYWKIETKEPI